MKRIAARLFTIVATVGVLVAPGASSGYAQPCQRTIGIDKQMSAGEGAGVLTFSVHSGGCAAAGTVAFVVSSGSAQANVDFQLPNGFLQWDAGDMGVRQINAAIVPDAALEANLEDFTVHLVAPSPDVRVGVAVGQGRILDDDDLDLIIVVDDVHCPPSGVKPTDDVHGESGNCGIVNLVLNVPMPSTVALHWSTVDGTALAGVDYVGVVDRIQPVPPGSTSVKLKIKLLVRPPDTPTRWFGVRIFGASSGQIIDSIAIITIVGS